MRKIHCDRLGISERAHGFVERPHGEQHALYVGVLNNRHPTLNPIAGIRHGLLVSALGCAKTLQSDLEARLVHHGKHAGESLIFLAHEVPDGPAIVAIGHYTGGATMDTQLVLNRDRVGVVALTQLNHRYSP